MSGKTKVRGQITYDDYFGHVCTCAERVERSNVQGFGDETAYTMERPVYDPTVHVAREIEPTESGSYWYVCERCGAGAWSGL